MSGEDAARTFEVSERYEPHELEPAVFDRWAAVDAYERTVEHRSDGEPFYFLDGPPYTSGAAHMGTTWNKILKDAYIRYHRMLGYDVSDRPGYDMHGLPIETRVEEQLGFENKRDIEALGEEEFIAECKSFAEEQLEGLQEDFKSFGVWMDWEDPYKTVDPEYMEAAWWAFSQANDRGLVERGKRSISQCPRCETAIANNEVEYADVEDPSIYVRFPLSDHEGSVVIWTTTPWTIPANTFVAVGEAVEYVGVDAHRDGETDRLYVAAGVLEEVLAAGGYDDHEVIERLDGADMVGWNYEHPLDDRVEHPAGEGAFEIYTAEYVEVDRTGLVHSAPGHGEEDFHRGTELGLDLFCPVGEDGRFDDRAGPYVGEFVRDANDEIIADLDAAGYLLAEETVEHSYGHCWRCDTGIVQIVTDQWFVTVTEIKDDLLANIEDSEWHPPEARDGRFRDFVSDSPDWTASRQRYWGTPVPIWLPAHTTEGEPVEWSGAMDDAIVIGDRAELAARVDQEIDPGAVDLHKDTVDELTVTEDGVVYERVPDVFDVWLDSAVASWGSLGYPGEEADYDQRWPADLIMEAHDQTRGWFWSQLAMGTTAVDQIPYEEVLMHGHALMPDGRAMSKSKGILIDPNEVIDEHGVDPMRAFLLSVTPQETDMSFSWDGVETMGRDLNILWNVFRFPLPYMELDGYDPAEYDLAAVEGDLTTVDRWLISRLQTVAAEAREHWEAFRQDRAFEAIREFVTEDLSRFYIQVVRERMWAETDDPEKRAAYETITYALHRVVALLAPFTPLLADEIYDRLTGDAGHPTVHMLDYPAPEEQFRDQQLERDVELLRAVEEGGSNARQQAERKLRWPVQEVVVAPDGERTAAAVDRHRMLIADRLNARRVEVLPPDEEWDELRYSADADMSELGPAFGGRATAVMEALNEARIEEPSLAALEEHLRGEGALEADEELTESMVSLTSETPEGVSGAAIEADGQTLGVVYVDTALTEEIESEGYAREVIRRIQEMRKELDLDIERRIQVEVTVDDDRVAELIGDHEELIAREVRAHSFETVEGGYHKEWEIEGVPVEIGVEPAPEAAA